METVGEMCELCQVPIVSEKVKAMHILGKKHKEAAAADLIEKSGIFVTGLPPQAQKNDVLQFFSQFGKVTKKSHFVDKNRYAIIKFDNPKPVEGLLKSVVKFQDRTLHIRRTHKRQDNGGGGRGRDVKSTDTYDLMYEKLEGLPDFNTQITKLITTLQPNLQEMSRNYHRLCCDLQEQLVQIFPGCTVYPFGSTMTGLCFKNSDVDVYVYVPEDNQMAEESAAERATKYVKKSKSLLPRLGKFSKIFAIPKAKTPIVKCIHNATNVSCDFNFKNMLGVCNTSLINYYLSLDKKLRISLILIKYWAKVLDLGGISGKFSNYSLALMMIFYLQHKPICLPPVAALQASITDVILHEGWNGEFIPKSFNPTALVKLTVPELLQGFFTFYANFDYALNVICPYIGYELQKTDFLNPDLLSDAFDKYKKNIENCRPLRVECYVCVQDPFELNHNTTGGVPAKVLEEFSIYCAFAAQALNDVDNNTIHNLFTDKHMFIERNRLFINDEKCTFKIAMLGNCVGYLQTLVSSDNMGDLHCQLKKAWYELVHKFLISVFVSVFKLNMTVKTDKSNSKSQKLDGQEDIYHTNVLDTVTFNCSVMYNLWDARKSIEKDVLGDNNNADTFLEKQIKLTDHILNVLYKCVQLKDPVVELELTISARANPTEMHVHLKLVKAKKYTFRPMAHYFAKNLAHWFERYIKDLRCSPNEEVVENKEEVATVDEK